MITDGNERASTILPTTLRQIEDTPKQTEENKKPYSDLTMAKVEPHISNGGVTSATFAGADKTNNGADIASVESDIF